MGIVVSLHLISLQFEHVNILAARMSPPVQGRGTMTPYHRGYCVRRTLHSIPHQNISSPCLKQIVLQNLLALADLTSDLSFFHV